MSPSPRFLSVRARGVAGAGCLLAVWLALGVSGCGGGPPGGEPTEAHHELAWLGADAGPGLPIWHQPGAHEGPHILTCYGGCSAPHYDPSACGGSTACCSNCIDGTWWYSTEQRNFGCGARLEISRGDRCVVVEVADNGPGDWVEDNAAATCGGSGWIIDTSPLVADYFGGGCGYGECFWVNVRQVDSSLPTGPCASCPCGCTPSAETCNGRDDDCDGTTDEGLSRSCGSDVGDCQGGTETCSGGSWGACQGAIGPQAEACDGRDNDCDGTIDEQLTRTCGTDEGDCQAGTETCAGGAWSACAGAVWPQPETCDGRDNDCDGVADDQLVRACGTDVGECRPGTEACAAGAWGACVGAVWPRAEECDALDNDCDGTSDDESVCEIEEVRLQAAMADGTTDVDGDGRPDLCGFTDAGLDCYRNTGHGFGVALAQLALSGLAGDGALAVAAAVRLGDLDGDGRADACARGAGGVRCWLSRGRGFDVEIPGPGWSDAAGWGGPEHAATLRLVDLNGDGLADLCGRGPGGFSCQLSTGTGFDRAALLPELSDAAGFDRVERYGTIRTGDVNGDGYGDVCARGGGGMSCWLGSGQGFSQRVPGPAWSDAAGWATYDHWSTIRLADVNGDGRADLCGRAADGIDCYLSSGTGFETRVPGPRLGDAAGWTDRGHFATIRAADVDGDGAADLCALATPGIACWLWSGTGFDRRLEGPALREAGGWAEASRYQSVRFADLEGDGRSDLLGRAADGLRLWFGTGTGFPTLLVEATFGDARGFGPLARSATLRIAGPSAAPRAAVRAPEVRGGCGVAVAPGATGAGDSRRARALAAAGLLVAAGALAAALLLPRRCRRRQRRS